MGWVAEAWIRSYALRGAILVSMLGALVAAVNDSVPTGPRVAMVVAGFTAPFVLLMSQLQSWPHGRQWIAIGLTLAVCLGLFLLVLA